MSRIPAATYRLQLHGDFRFADAHAIVDYLAELGISHIYAAPIFAAKNASSHGYDVVDPTRLNPSLGTRGEFDRLIDTLHARGMGWIQDIVPNHMAFDSGNRMLMDVMENGKASRYYQHFDITWDHPDESFRNRVLAPFLGKFYGESLESGELRLHYDADGLRIRYYDLALPLCIETYPKVFAHRLSLLKRRLGRDHPDSIKYLGVLYALRNLPAAEEEVERAEQSAFAKRMLWELYIGNETIHGFVDENLTLFNGQPGEPESYNLLDDLLADQVFRLSFWKVATEEINYRRFFSINGLISVRVEDETVFRDTHALILRLCAEGKFDGLRIDHVDGLYDPTAYLQRLRAAAADQYIVVEKIFQPEEELNDFWPVEGSTGYGFLSRVNGLFCERKNDRRFDKIYSRFTGEIRQFERLTIENKRLIIRRQITGDVDRLARLLKDISSRDRYARDITLLALRRALIEILSFFPVYRTYVDGTHYTDQDRAFMQRAINRARDENPALLLELNFIEKFLLLQFHDGLPEEEKARWVHFVMLFQQLTSPLMAKGVEDTALYVYAKLLSLNEVGSNPGRFGTTPIEFHHFCRRRAGRWPHAMNATATHDTKRGEDARARIHVLSELPERWERRVHAWRKLNQAKKRRRAGLDMPDANDEYFYYQTLIGAYPINHEDSVAFLDRIKEYVIKAVREAARHTAWLKPDTDYEQAYTDFVAATLEAEPENPFLNDFLPFQRDIARWGILNSLSQLLLKLACPGVPDIYQGCELWDLSLVDPDNRRPVNYEYRAHLLAEFRTREAQDLPGLIAELLELREDGRIKLFTLYRGLQARKRQHRLFTDGDYVPLVVQGTHRNHALAFARVRAGEAALVVIPRRVVPLVAPDRLPCGEEVWADTRLVLPDALPSQWRHAFTGEHLTTTGTLPLAAACARYPLALLQSG